MDWLNAHHILRCGSFAQRRSIALDDQFYLLSAYLSFLRSHVHLFYFSFLCSFRDFDGRECSDINMY